MNKNIFYLLLDINNIINNCVNKEKTSVIRRIYKSFDSIPNLTTNKQSECRHQNDIE